MPEPWLNRLPPSPTAAIRFRRLWKLDEVAGLVAPRRKERLEAPAFYLLQLGRRVDKLRFLAGLAPEAVR